MPKPKFKHYLMTFHVLSPFLSSTKISGLKINKTVSQNSVP